MNTITNSTNYDKNFYKLIAMHKLFIEPLSLIGAFAVVLCCYYGVTLFVGGVYDTTTFVYLALGLILVPITCFVMPYKRNSNAYEEAMRLTKGKPYVVTVKFSLDSLNKKNSLSQSALYKYSEVKSINVKGNLIIIKISKRNPIYMNKESFVDSTYDDFKMFLAKNSEIKIDE